MHKKFATDGSRKCFDADKADILARIMNEDDGNWQEETLYHTAKNELFIERITGDESSSHELRECTEVTPQEALELLNKKCKPVPRWLENIETQD